MQSKLGFRIFVILVVVGFLGYMAFTGTYKTARGEADGLQLGIDLQGGSQIDGKFDFADKDPGDRAKLLQEAIGIIEERIDGYGLKDIVIQPIGDERFSIQISAKGKENVEAIKGLITVLGRLEFRITVEPSATNYEYYWNRFKEALDKGVEFTKARDINALDRTEDDRDNGRYQAGLRWYMLSDKGKDSLGANPKRLPPGGAHYILCQLDDYQISGESLTSVTHRRSTEGLGGDWRVVFSIHKMHQANMAGLTQNEGDYMAIILNDEVDSAPILRSTLSDSGEISGSFNEDEARALSAVLQAGALREKPELTAERTVASDLAGDARKTGILSVLAGFCLVLVVMVWLYLGPGLLANIALLLNLVLVVGVLYWFGAVLTLPGLAGLVLTVGMAVDANILVFERIKEEKSKGRTVAQAVATGYDRALVTIIDSNLTTLITAYMLFQIGSGPVRGFGITLAIGIIASMFTALYVTRTLFALLLKRGVIDKARMRGEFSPPSIRWMSMKRTAVTLSTIAMVGGLVLYLATPEKKKYDLDFTQGAKLIMRCNRTLDLDDVRNRIIELGRKDVRFSDVNVRVSAEGIGASVGASAGDGFELRTQQIGRKDDIDDFVAELRSSFRDDLLPGPFEATVAEAPGGRAAGTIYFVEDAIEPVLLSQAFRQSGRLTDPRIKRLESAPGAGSAFELSFSEPASNPGGLALNVRQALAKFEISKARGWLETRTTSNELTLSQQQAARAALLALEPFGDEKLPASYFRECDPFPLADRIDPSTARQHRDAAVKAIAFSIIGIIIYVAFRFRSWAFGFAAVVALIHDVLVVLGVVALVNWLGLVDARLNLVTVAAFLTLIGYSINDSIVIFDRIRENRGTGRARLSEIIDKSLNQTLGRTLRTTGTTWLVVFMLLAMNYGANSTLEGFAFILVLGVLVGTYSSIFIAAPTLLYLPWLWERCGSSIKSFAIRCVPWVIGAAVLLLVYDGYLGNLQTSDPSATVLDDLVVAFPAGILGLFLFNFLRFVRREEPTGETTAA